MSDALPRPVVDTVPGWETDLAKTLGYTFADEIGERMPDGSPPTAWTLSLPPFSFLEPTREVIAWEIEGEPDETGIRRAHLDPSRPGEILLRPVRYRLPEGFEFVTITDTDGVEHRIALRTAA